MTKLQWEAKKAAYRVFRMMPKERSEQQKLDLEDAIAYVYEAYGIPTESHNAQIIYGYFAFN